MVRTRSGACSAAAAQSSCKSCEESDDMQMVQCDRCNEWFHFRCVNVSEEIAESDWACEECKLSLAATGAEKEQSSMSVNVDAFSSPIGVNTQQEQHVSTVGVERGKVSANVSECGRSEQERSRRTKRLELLRLEEERQLKLTYIEKKYEIMEKYEDDDFDGAGVVDVSVGIKRQTEMGGSHESLRALSGYAANVNKDFATHDNVGNWVQATEKSVEQETDDINHGIESLRLNEKKFKSCKLEVTQNLSERQINARHIVPNELPSFSGNPEDWPLFISSFENSTRICGFSNDENLLRLQRTLRGRAREYVCSYLMLPALVPKVIATLRMVFGRPENIINTLMVKIRGTACVNQNKLDTLINFALEVRNLAATMEASDLQTHLSNPMLIQELIEKLPASMSLQWAVHRRTLKNENLMDFSDWLFELAELASSVVTVATGRKDPELRKTQRTNFHEEERMTDTSKVLRCYCCEEGHPILKCEKFKRLNNRQKWDELIKKKLCRYCLKKHDFRNCNQQQECGVNGCTVLHHPILHRDDNQEIETVESVVAVHRMQTSNVLFRMVPITIYGKHKSIDLFAFLDDGSGPTLIEQSVLDELELEGKKKELCLRWTDGTVRSQSDSQILNLRVSQQDRPDRMYQLTHVQSVKSLELPSQTMNYTELANKYKHLRGLPVESYHDISPKMIIGLNNRNVLMPLKFREGKAYEPAATKTRLGWTIYGVHNYDLCKNERDRVVNLQLHICECDDASLHDLVLENMRLEESLTATEKKDCLAEEELNEKVSREGDHFVAKLLWKTNEINMLNNFDMAFRRLKSFERKLKSDDDLKTTVMQHIEEMENKQYIRKLSNREVTEVHPRTWYLPIFTVKNPNKPSKIRIVWDAAAKYNGVSLNDCLLKGPDLLTSLPSVPFNFRTGKVGICGDICEMFHRVAVDKDDQNAQRFLWRHCESNERPGVYILQVLSFGAKCSPSLAQFAKNKNAKEHEKQHPRAAKSIIERHYVDDMLDSMDTVEEVIQLATEVREIHARGGFRIRNWISNSGAVLEALGEQGAAETFCKAGRMLEQTIEAEKILGMWWLTTEDKFTFSLKFTKACEEVLSGLRLPTKRELLRLLMSIFDPLGLLSFFTVHMKILLQDVWRSCIDWDEALPTALSDVWRRWLNCLEQVTNVRVPRCYFMKGTRDNCKVQLHVFTDASEGAYAAVAYFRIESAYGIETSLVCAKTKVAPLRPISIPRMELLAALTGARLASTVRNGHDLSIVSTHYWTDSKTVLLWLRSDPRSYKPFVKFRVAEIQELSKNKQWKYVPTKLNVADQATKWSRSPIFNNNNPWFTGPHFLRLSEEEWPMSETTISDTDDHACEVVVQQHAAVIEKQTIIDASRFSKWERILRTTAYVKFFIEKLKIRISSTPEKEPTFLTTDFLLWSEQLLIRLAQKIVFSKEIRTLQSDQQAILPKTSPLRKLSPFIDNAEIVRMRGRLENAPEIINATKNPIILPKEHYITHLIVDWYHRKYKHINHETAINEIFQKYHIPGLRSLLRSVRSNCQLCKNYKATPSPPEMGQLPEGRLAAYQRPFSHVGLDFFGPLLVTVGRRTEKRYGAIFTCMTCRAVHIEVAHSLSMNSCVMVIRNFIARRGVPIQMYSDNGTNLKAAEKELRQAYAAINFEELRNEFTSTTTTWSFIPPASPHMGGVWERLVRSIKNVLYQTITPDTKINDEKLHNLLVEVESIINSRPLTYLALDTADQEALTPNHFLLGSSSGSKPPGKFEKHDRYVRESWRHSQFLAERFWQRWVAEVLPDLTRRTNWFQKVKPIQKDDVVIIVDSNSPRHTWCKGIITEVFAGRDGQVRSAKVRTTSGEYHRPAAKLAVLDVKPVEDCVN